MKMRASRVLRAVETPVTIRDAAGPDARRHLPVALASSRAYSLLRCHPADWRRPGPVRRPGRAGRRAALLAIEDELSSASSCPYTACSPRMLRGPERALV